MTRVPLNELCRAGSSLEKSVLDPRLLCWARQQPTHHSLLGQQEEERHLEDWPDLLVRPARLNGRYLDSMNGCGYDIGYGRGVPHSFSRCAVLEKFEKF